MITDSGTQFSQWPIQGPTQGPIVRPIVWKGLRRSGFTLVSTAALLLASPAAAQQVRSIQAPAPYNACNLRSQGGTQYSIVGTFRNGSAVTLLGDSGRGWYRVQVGEAIGWMARQCLRL